jgi:hypothetical protein
VTDPSAEPQPAGSAGAEPAVAAAPPQAAPPHAAPPPAEPGEAEAPTGPTGHSAVDAAVARLAEQAELPPAEQVAGYEAAQRALQQTLASIDQS